MAYIASTPSEISMFQALAIKGALKLYVNTGIKANRAYTPSNMLAMVTKITGKKFKRGQNAQALKELELWIETTRNVRGH